MQDKTQDVWKKFLRESLKTVTDEELAILDKIGNGHDDPHEIMRRLFVTIENEKKRRL